MTNYEIISNTEAFKTYIEDPEDLYADASSIDKWELVFKELKEKGYELNFNIMDLVWAYRDDSIEFLPEIY